MRTRIDPHKPFNFPPVKVYPVWVSYILMTKRDILAGCYPFPSAEGFYMDEDPACPSEDAVNRLKKKIANCKAGDVECDITILHWQSLKELCN